MKLRRFTDPVIFHAHTAPFLVADEPAHLLPLGLVNTYIQQPTTIPAGLYLASVESSGAVVATALMTPPLNVILSRVASPDALDPIIDDLLALGSSPPGAIGPCPVSRQFSERWCARTGQTFARAMAQRAYRLDRVIPVTGVPGELRQATIADRAILVAMSIAFNAEAESVVNAERVARWAEKYFKHPHGNWVAPDQTLYLTDRDRQTVTQWTLEGELLRTWGTPDQPGAPGDPFNEPTRAMVAPNGDLYVSDGYGQFRAHRFAPDGTLLRSWGEKGTGPGQFGWPVHSVHWHPEGRAMIIDRENHRIQHFTPEGDYHSEWNDFSVPQDLFLTPENVIFVAEGHPRITLMALDGTIIDRWGERGDGQGQFKASPHGCWVDSQGSLYVGEVTTHNCFQKFVRV